MLLLLVQSAWHEPELGAKVTDSIASDLARHLHEITRWQGLNQIQIADKGNLAKQLRSANQSREGA